MTPWLHLLFVPALLLAGIQIGIVIGMRMAASQATRDAQAGEAVPVGPAAAVAHRRAA